MRSMLECFGKDSPRGLAPARRNPHRLAHWPCCLPGNGGWAVAMPAALCTLPDWAGNLDLPHELPYFLIIYLFLLVFLPAGPLSNCPVVFLFRFGSERIGCLLFAFRTTTSLFPIPCRLSSRFHDLLCPDDLDCNENQLHSPLRLLPSARFIFPVYLRISLFEYTFV